MYNILIYIKYSCKSYNIRKYTQIRNIKKEKYKATYFINIIVFHINYISIKNRNIAYKNVNKHYTKNFESNLRTCIYTPLY